MGYFIDVLRISRTKALGWGVGRSGAIQAVRYQISSNEIFERVK